MADLNMNFRQTVNPKVTQRTVLLGRVKMAQAIHMRESEWAKALTEIEKDPLFQELLGSKLENERIISYKRYGRMTLSGQFYEMQDLNVVGGGGESPETLLNQKKHLLKLIQKIGQENFEKHFLYRDEGVALDDIAKKCNLSMGEATELQEFIMTLSVQAEFYHPSGLQAHNLVKPTLIGRIIQNEDKTFSMSFFSPHLARGRYEINLAALKKWQKEKHLNRTDSSRLRKFIGILELCNLKQGAFLRTIEYLLSAQKDFLETKDMSKMAPISLRQVSKILQFAPSTISRVMATKSVMLPWDHEVLLGYLMPGKRKVVLNILEKLIPTGEKNCTDQKLATLIASTYGIKVSRRTITACRAVLGIKSE